MSEKSIYFCDIDWDRQYMPGRYTSLMPLVNEYFDNPERERRMLYKKKEVVTKLLEITDNYVFGIYSYLSDFKSEMARARDAEGNEIDTINLKLEYFSFFYIDLTANNLAYIHNNHLPDIRDLLPAIVKSKLELNMLMFEVKNIQIAPDALIGRLQAFNNPVISFQAKRLGATRIWNQGDIDMDDYDVVSYEFKIKPRRKGFLSKLLNHKDQFSKLKLEGKLPVTADDDITEEKREIFNLLKNTFSRKTKIDSEQIQSRNTMFLRDYLKRELHLAFNAHYIQRPGSQESLKQSGYEQIPIDSDQRGE